MVATTIDHRKDLDRDVAAKLLEVFEGATRPDDFHARHALANGVLRLRGEALQQ